MIPLTIYVVDDELVCVASMRNYIDQDGRIISIGYETDPLKAEYFFRTTDKLPDIICLDIEMQKVKGPVLAELIKGKSMIIFITAHAEFAVASYKLGAVDYLLKPFALEDFKAAIQKCVKLKEAGLALSKLEDRFLYVKDARTGKDIRIEKDRVFYLESCGNYTRIFMEDNTFVMPIMTLKNIVASLAADDFIRVHKSFAVNLHKIKSVGLRDIELINGYVIAVGRLYKRSLKQGMDRMKTKS